MDIAPNIDAFLLFVLLVFPGMVAMRVYRLLMPAVVLDWKESTLEAAFFSAVNFALFLPLLAVIGAKGFADDHPVLFALAIGCVILVGPILITRLFVWLRRSKWLNAGLQLPHPTAWDYFFDQRRHCFVRLHLKEGGYIGGWFSSGSFAAAFPRHGDIYIERVYRIDKDGVFGEPMRNSLGVLVRAEDYTLAEFIAPDATAPVTKEQDHAGKTDDPAPA